MPDSNQTKSNEPNSQQKPLKQISINGNANKLHSDDRQFHDWYRFVLSFPPHLVRDYLSDFAIKEGMTVLDPFCGTGTTLIESRLSGFSSVGIEANPFAHFASKVKTDWSIDSNEFLACAREIAASVKVKLLEQGINDDTPFDGDISTLQLKNLKPDQIDLLISDSISKLPLHKALILLDGMKSYRNKDYYYHMLLAFSNALVFSFSNLRFGPEVGIGKIKKDTPVVSSWLEQIEKIASDIFLVRGQLFPQSKIYLGDSREVHTIIESRSVDAVITSPPYPNEKDYTRTTRLESVILDFFSNKSELRQFKKSLVRSNTRGVYKGDDDYRWVQDIEEIQRIAKEIEQKRIELKKTSGFEKLYGTVTLLYFGGMAKHLAGLRSVLRPGAKLAYVVGDQASYLRVFIPTGQLLVIIAEKLGYRHIRTDLFRTRYATASQEQLREEVVILEWKG